MENGTKLLLNTLSLPSVASCKAGNLKCLVVGKDEIHDYKSRRRQHLMSGFTLIELLVVVLIIGILTAAAVPLYEKATRKAQFVQVQTTLTAMMRDIDAYTMENGYDTGNFNTLIQSAYTGCTNSTNGWGMVYCSKQEGTYWTQINNYTIYLSFSPDPSLFVSNQGERYSFSKSVGKPWTWNNGGPVTQQGHVSATYNETFQMFCDWWIKMGDKPVSGSAKTVADESCL